MFWKNRLKYSTTTERMVPNWITIVNSLVKSSCAIPKKEDVIIMCPVEDTGKYSVMPSIMARTIASNMSKIYFFLCGFNRMAYTSIPSPINTKVGARRILLKL